MCGAEIELIEIEINDESIANRCRILNTEAKAGPNI